MRVLVDTNVVCRLLQTRHTQQSEAAQAIEHLETAGHELCLVPQVLYEFWAVATRPAANNGLGMTVADTQGFLRRWQQLFTLLRDERTIFDRWEDLVATYAVQGKGSHDARLVAAMQRHALTHLLTFNISDFLRYRGISAVAPVQARHLPAS